MMTLFTIAIGCGLVLCGFMLGAMCGVKGSAKAILNPYEAKNAKVIKALLYHGLPPRVLTPPEPWKGMQS